jgi:hypothetical protein
MDALTHGLRTDGWLVSQSLLIWGKDDKGVEQNLIIDGEHRYSGALKVGITTGPMVLLDGLTEIQAKALTIKMNQKRGDFDDAALELLIRELVADAGSIDGMDLDLGFDERDLIKMAGAVIDAALDVEVEDRPVAKVEQVTFGQKVPLVFFVENAELDFFKKPFLSQKNPTDLDADVLRSMIESWKPRR